MSPGLGPWRFDMAPYVDEHGPDLVVRFHSFFVLFWRGCAQPLLSEESQNRNIKIILFEIDLLVLAVVICLKILTCAINCVFFLKALGLEWHSKILLRIEIAGTIINAYDTYTEWFKTEGTFPVDYFVGGLVTGGIAFQPSGALTGESSGEQFDDLIGRWMARYKKYGHAREDGVHKPLHARGRAHTHACMSGRARTHTNAHAHTHTHADTDAGAHTYAHCLKNYVTHPCVRVRTCACACACACGHVCVYVCLCVYARHAVSPHCLHFLHAICVIYFVRLACINREHCDVISTGNILTITAL